MLKIVVAGRCVYMRFTFPWGALELGKLTKSILVLKLLSIKFYVTDSEVNALVWCKWIRTFIRTSSYHLINLIQKDLILDFEDAIDRYVYAVIYFALGYTNKSSSEENYKIETILDVIAWVKFDLPDSEMNALIWHEAFMFSAYSSLKCVKFVATRKGIQMARKC